MAQNVEVKFDEATGMLHFIVDPTLVVGETDKGAQYISKCERFGEQIDGAPGFKFNLAVWYREPQPEKPKTAAQPTNKRLTGAAASVFQKKAAPPVQKDVAPARPTVNINRIKG